MSSLLAILTAIGWATSDYVGGLASRKIKSATLTLYAQSLSLFLLIPAAILFGGSPTWRDIGIGAIAGIFNVLGYTLLVEGTSRGRIGATISTSAVVGVLLPVIAGVALGDHLSPLAQLGILLALIGTTVVSSEGTEESTSRWNARTIDNNVLKFGGGAGVAFSVVFILLSLLHENAGLWPVLAMRLSIPLVYVYARRKDSSLTPKKMTIFYGAAAALPGTMSLCLFTLAVRDGAVSIVTAIASTSPVGTVMLAHFLRAERTTAPQLAGVVVAISGVVILALY